MTVAGAAPQRGQETVFARPVLSAPAFVKRDGTVLADAWLPEEVRLGVLEAHLGDGVIEKIAAKGVRDGRLPLRERRRLLSYPMVIRLVIAMTLLPGSSYAEAARVLAGLLADVPFTLDWHVPTGKTVGEWRMLIPPEIMQEVFWHAAGALIGDDEPSAVLVAGMPADAADGMLVNVAGTPNNREYFGTTRTGDGSSPFPQARIVALTARAGRAIRGAVLGTARDGEQTLLKRLADEQPGLFAGRVTLFDRNFPGHDVILAVLLAKGHVIARARGGIALPFHDGQDKGWLPNGYPDQLAERPLGEEGRPAPGPGRRALRPGHRQERGRNLRDLHPDHHAPRRGQACRPASCGRPTRTGGPRRRPRSARTRPPSPAPGTGPPGPSSAPAARGSPSRRSGPGSGTQLVRAGEAATLRSEEAAARALRRADAKPVTADEESFTAAWHHAVRSMETTQVTASSSLAALAAAQDAAARAHLHTLNIPGRDRHSPREQKARPKFPHTSATKLTVTGKYQVIVYAPGRS